MSEVQKVMRSENHPTHDFLAVCQLIRKPLRNGGL